LIPTKKFSVIPASAERKTGIIKKEQTRRVKLQVQREKLELLKRNKLGE